MTFAGLIADSRTLVERAQIEAQSFWFTYNRKIRVEDVTQSVANLALQFGDDDAKVREKTCNQIYASKWVFYYTGDDIRFGRRDPEKSYSIIRPSL